MRFIILGVVATLAVAGCGSSAKKAPPTPTTPQDRYVAALRHLKLSEGSLASYSDADLIATGKNVCDILAHPAAQTYSKNPVDDLVHAGWDVVPAEAVVTTAKKTIC